MEEPKAKGEFAKLERQFNEVYLLKDPYVLKTVCMAVLSQRVPGDPIWIVIVAPSGGAKSEFINAVSKCVGVFPLSTLTSRTFVSGMKGGEQKSLLKQIENGIITFKDLTSLLSEHKEERSVIMAQLREIYDGKYAKQFGTGETVEWAGKITVLAGSTYAIHSLKQQYTAMGERFLFYNMIQPDRKEAARKTMENQEEGNMAAKRLGLQESMGHFMNDTIIIPAELPKIPRELQEKILDLAELATRSRSDVERNYRSPQQEIIAVHPPEMPTRFAGQLQGCIRSLMILNWNETGKMDLLDGDRVIVYKLALDSITMSRRIVMQELARYDSLNTAGLAVKINLPTNTVRRWLEDLVALEIADRQKGSGSKGDLWSIKQKYRDIICEFEGIEALHADLIEIEEPVNNDGDGPAMPTQEEVKELLKVDEEIDVNKLGL